MRAAVGRTTSEGRVLDGQEALEPEEALGLFTGPADDPGGQARRVRVGAPADLCLLDRPWAEVRRRPEQRAVRATIIDGAVVYDRAANG